jgi:hypothetical protein
MRRSIERAEFLLLRNWKLKIARNLIALGWIVFALAMTCRFLRPDSVTFLSPLVAVFALFTLTKATFIYWIIRVYMRKVLKQIQDKEAAEN